MPRLGFLAITFGDGACRVFDVPDPSAFETGEENGPVFGTHCCHISLKVETDRYV
jgi:hypothetical protein